MRATTTLLVSTDPSLILEVGRLHDADDRSRLEVCGHVEKAFAQASREEVRVVLIHLPPDRDPAPVARLLRARSEAPPAATAVICEPTEVDRLTGLGAGDQLFLKPDPGELCRFLEAAAQAARPPEAARDRNGHAKYHNGHANGRNGFANGHANGRARGDSLELIALSGDDEQLPDLERVATQDTTVLLSGETGTGKTMLARRIHERSSRRGEPFLVVDCGSLSASLIESEMFGHVRGAFTGADRDRPGKFEAVGRGTLVLDEINSLPLSLQSKLLRAVEERVFEPVGSNKSQPLRARLIAVSNRRLEDEVAAGRFRSDLYYRLNVVAFQLPPLRERREVVEQLVFHFLAEFGARYNRPVEAAVPEALALLESYHWPGNVRELRNAIERAVALCSSPTVQVRDLPPALRPRPAAPTAPPAPVSPVVYRPAPAAPPAPAAGGQTELERITAALALHRNNRARTAAALGMSRVSLYKKLRKYGLMEPTADPAEEATDLADLG